MPCDVKAWDNVGGGLRPAILFYSVWAPLSPMRERGWRGRGTIMPAETFGRDQANRPRLTARARELRHLDTLAEKLGWRLLRNRQLLGYKFRRQVPLDTAIVDFSCMSLKLVVELDGAGHAYESQAKRDRRDREL